MLYTEAFPSPVLTVLFKISLLLFKPFWSMLSGLISLCISTTKERSSPWRLFFKRSLLISPLLCLCLLFAPFAIVGFALRCVLYLYKNPHWLSVRHTEYNNKARKRKTEFGVATLNLCLMPEFMARFNNLSHTHARTTEIGKRIVIDQMHYNHTPSNDGDHRDDKVTMTTGVSSHFPNMDFLCIQEVWQTNYSDLLVEELHKVYPYIVRDVGVYSATSNYFMLNSGLMIASKYEILDAEFKYFTSSCFHCVYAAKGLLMVKVLLWYENMRENKAVVGYVYSTQMQAYQGKNMVSDKQLDEIMKWTKEFREKNRGDNEVVAFDVVGGDFNFDNLSPGDKVPQEHEIFDIYHDEGRQAPGKEHDWIVGTELRQPYIYDEEISSPDKFKKCLESPLLRQQYILDGDIVEASLDSLVNTPPKTEISPVGGKRRIDFILHHKDFPVVPTRYNFVTRLPRLTDHIPVVLNFRLRSSLD